MKAKTKAHIHDHSLDDRDHQNLTQNTVYTVIGVTNDEYRVVNNNGEPILYPKQLFEVIDNQLDGGWMLREFEDGEYFIDPPQIADVGFYERYFDGDPEARVQFEGVLASLTVLDPAPTQLTYPGPGQLKPNNFEAAILERIYIDNPAVQVSIDELRILSREFTGVGSYTRFQCDELGPITRHSFSDQIKVPGVSNGLGAILLCKSDKPECLEIYTYGDERWDGIYEGFSIEEVSDQY